MAGPTNKKKTPKQRRWIIPKLFMLLGIVILSGILVAIFVMEQELNRIGFFNKGKRLPLQLPQTQQKDAPVIAPPPAPVPPQTSQPLQPAPVAIPSPETGRSPAQVTGQSAVAPTTSEGISAEDRKRMEGLTSSRSPEKLSQDDRKSLEDILRKHPR